MGWLLLLVAIVGGQGTMKTGSADKRLRRNSQIVFVCEHGAALSVVSAAYFNKMAREQHLDLRAIARGTSPQEDVSAAARRGLKADGIALETKRPQVLSGKDTAHARRIVAFCPIPSKYSKKTPVETWNDVSWPAASYGPARDAILKHLEELMKELKAEE
ncbi:MAG TPA: hypothetical protein VI685_24435 [Candidatus Angelobacter sp.]